MILTINIPALLVPLFIIFFFSKCHCSSQDNENVTRSTNLPSSLFLECSLPSVFPPHHLQLKIYLFVISMVFLEVSTPSAAQSGSNTLSLNFQQQNSQYGPGFFFCPLENYSIFFQPTSKSDKTLLLLSYG